MNECNHNINNHVSLAYNKPSKVVKRAIIPSLWTKEWCTRNLGIFSFSEKI